MSDTADSGGWMKESYAMTYKDQASHVKVPARAKDTFMFRPRMSGEGEQEYEQHKALAARRARRSQARGDAVVEMMSAQPKGAARFINDDDAAMPGGK